MTAIETIMAIFGGFQGTNSFRKLVSKEKRQSIYPAFGIRITFYDMSVVTASAPNLPFLSLCCGAGAGPCEYFSCCRQWQALVSRGCGRDTAGGRSSSFWPHCAFLLVHAAYRGQECGGHSVSSSSTLAGFLWSLSTSQWVVLLARPGLNSSTTQGSIATLSPTWGIGFVTPLGSLTQLQRCNCSLDLLFFRVS